MKIDQAIKTLRYIGRARTIMWKQEHYDALRMGIEALKGYQEGRTLPGGQFFHDLPGETLD